MIVKIYMSSCCDGGNVIDVVNEAVRLSGVDAKVETVTDMAEVMRAKVISTPTIKINNRVVASGRVPKVQDLVTLLTDAAAKEVQDINANK
jgi:alkyl hydroperoxide reductase subunit AhpF